MKKKILYVEDELNLGTIVSETLEVKGYDVRLIKDGARVMESFASFTPDICILDVMLPHIDGFVLGKEIKDRFPDMPVIFLTAKTQTQDVVKGFASGGTDYLRKPFSMEELVVRIENQFALQQKENKYSPREDIKLGNFRYMPHALQLTSETQSIQLSNREAEVLNFFVRHINQTVDRKNLLLAVWGDDSFFHSRNLDVYIRKLREYFLSDNSIQIITLKGKGYQFVVNKV